MGTAGAFAGTGPAARAAAAGTAGTAGGAGTANTPDMAGMAGGPAPGRVLTGCERLAADGYAELAGQRVGVVTNPTGITSDARHLVDVLHADPRVDLVAVFGPEHGFRGSAQAGGSEGTGRDPATGLPVYDTYDTSGQRLADLFTAAGIDTVVFDIQDVGARFYTYVWTLYDCMRAAALAGKAVVVLDRPNPVGGRRAAGPVLERPYASFVGREPIALAHGMTAAELALLFNGEFLRARPVRLRTVPMTGWRRASFYGSTGLPWVPPSPNMPTPDTALAYAGTCLFEGTTLSEGRGTTTPSRWSAPRAWTGGGRRRRTRWGCPASGSGRPGSPLLLEARRKALRRGPADRARPRGLRPGAGGDRPPGHRAAGVERFRLARGPLDRPADRLGPGADAGGRGGGGGGDRGRLGGGAGPVRGGPGGVPPLPLTPPAGPCGSVRIPCCRGSGRRAPAAGCCVHRRHGTALRGTS